MTTGATPVLLYGGTFDPPHLGHTATCRAVADALGASRVICIPAALSPTKTDAPTAAVHRLEMLRLAFADDPRVEISTIELDRDGASYFVDTVRTIRTALGPAAPLRFLIGADHALGFHRWHDPDGILACATPAIVARPPETPDSLRAALAAQHRDDPDHARCDPAWVVDAPLVDISATGLRDRLHDGTTTDRLIAPAVARYIAEHRLY